MTRHTFDVLLQGTPFCDLTFTFTHLEGLPPLGQEVFADDFAVNPGGVFNIAAALTSLSLRVGLIAVLGNDMFSRFVAERMERCGLSTALTEWIDRPLPVVTVGISFPHDRLYISTAPKDFRRKRRMTVEDLDRYQPRAIFNVGWIDEAVRREARARGILTYIDACWDRAYLHDPGLRSLARSVDVFSTNLPEALEMTGAGSPEAALEVLSEWTDSAVIKLGPRGCIAARAGRRYEVPAPEVATVDTTGAGDNFNAGLIYGLLKDYPFEKSLRCAVLAGSLSTTALGGSCQAYNAGDIELRLAVDEPDESSVGTRE